MFENINNLDMLISGTNNTSNGQKMLWHGFPPCVVEQGVSVLRRSTVLIGQILKRVKNASVYLIAFSGRGFKACPQC